METQIEYYRFCKVKKWGICWQKLTVWRTRKTSALTCGVISILATHFPFPWPSSLCSGHPKFKKMAGNEYVIYSNNQLCTIISGEVAWQALHETPKAAID